VVPRSEKRSSRIIAGALSILLVGSFFGVQEQSAPTAQASVELTPFTCSPFLYQFVGGTFYELNATNGEYEDYGTAGAAPHEDLGAINSIGYNTADNFIYGNVGSRLFRVGTDGYEEVELRSGDESELDREYSGDFIAPNKLLIGPRSWATVDLSTTPPTVSDYSITGGFSPADFTVDSDGVYAYGMSRDTLSRLTLGDSSATTDSVDIAEELDAGLDAAKEDGTVPSGYSRNSGGGWGSAYSTSSGELFFFRNEAGSVGSEVWKLEFDGDPFDGGSVSAQLMGKQDDLSGGNDGASCPNAPSPFTTPETVDDSYAFSTGDTFSSPAGGGLLEGDTASSSGLVLYKISFDDEFPDDSTLYRLPNDPDDLETQTAAEAENDGDAQNKLTSGGVTVEVTDWDTGAFSVSGLSGAGGTTTFYYTAIEQTKQLSQTRRRETSNVGTVTIATLSVDANASGGSNTDLPSATQYVDYTGHTFAATSGVGGSIFWHAEYVEDSSGDSLPDNPVNTTSLPSGLSLNSSTGALSGIPVGSELASDTDYTIRVFAALDSQFKTSAYRDFSLTVAAPTQYSLTYSANTSHSADQRISGSPPTTQTGARLTIEPASGLSDVCFAFDSWNTASNGSGTEFAPGDQITFTDDTLPISDPTAELPAQNTTLYAQWTDTRINLTYNGNSSDGGSVPSDSDDYCDGDSITVKANPNTLSRTGFRLTGWDRDQSATTPESPLSNPASLTASTSDITVYAIWSEEFGVTFDANGATSGSVPTDNSDYISGQTVTLPTNSGSLGRTGFSFGGWNTEDDGSGTTYAASGSATLSMPSADLTLYAIWTARSEPSPGGGGGDDDDNDRRTSRPSPPVTSAGPVLPRPPSRPAPNERSSEPGIPDTDTSTTDAEGPASGSVQSPAPQLRSAAVPEPTVDTGSGLQRAGSSTGSLASLESARRSLAEVSRERLAGFLPSAPVTIEVRGARTAARFVTDEEILTNPPLLLEQVALASQGSVGSFVAVDELVVGAEPRPSIGPLPEETERITELFESAGLQAPRLITDEERVSLGGKGWIQVNSSVREYKPGSVVYLVVNSEPLIVGHATVGDDGTAQVAGDIPIGWFGIGEHRIRAVGVKQFDGIQVDTDGELVIPDNVLGKIREFDLGTQATVLATGSNPEGSSHLAVRVVPLEPEAPWWTLWILASAFLLMLVARIRGVLQTRSQAVIGGFAIILSAIPGVVLGWTSTVTIVAIWAAILGLAGAVLLVIIPARKTEPGSRGA